MKRPDLIVLCLLLTLALTGCSGREPAATAVPTEMSAAETAAPETGDAHTGDDPSSSAAYDHVDWDLTALSSYVIYAQIFNMAASPDTYEGQVVRLKGTFGIDKGAAPDGGDVYSLVTFDEEACCTQSIGLQFAKAGQLPKNGREATVTGVFHGYRENGANACMLLDAVLN